MTDVAAAPLYTRAQVDHCAFPAWFPSLRHVSIKSELLPLPSAFVALLLADGVKLTTMPSASRIEQLPDDDEASIPPTKSTTQMEAQRGVEKEVRLQIETAIRALGGAVFPKLNWSCPRDASWMLGSLKCVNYEDVFLLLKSSDFVVHDLTQPYAGCSEPQHHALAPQTATLVLRKWCNFYDSMHFRCFVVGHALVGVSQRHCDEFYEFLLDQQDHLCELIYRFFHAHLAKASSPTAFPDPDFIFDVYVDKQHRVFLVDINVFGAVTDPLLFSWEELLTMREEVRQRRVLRGSEDDEDAVDDGDDEQAVDFRVVESAKGIRPNPLSSYRAPTDFVDHLAEAGGFDAFINQVRRDNAGLTDDDDDDEEEEEEDDDDDVKWGSDNDD